MNAQERYERAAKRLEQARIARDAAWGEWEAANEHRRDEWVNISLEERSSKDVGDEFVAACREYYAADQAAHGSYAEQLLRADYELRDPRAGNSFNA